MDSMSITRRLAVQFAEKLNISVEEVIEAIKDLSGPDKMAWLEDQLGSQRRVNLG